MGENAPPADPMQAMMAAIANLTESFNSYRTENNERLNRLERERPPPILPRRNVNGVFPDTNQLGDPPDLPPPAPAPNLAQQTQEILNRRNNERNRPYNEDRHLPPEVKLLAPTFAGKLDPAAYLEWERRMEHLFEYYAYTEPKKIALAIASLTDHALAWWDREVAEKRRLRYPQITRWSDMKFELNRRYVPPHYHRDLLKRFRSLFQGSRSVEEYYEEFDLLRSQLALDETEESLMSQFMDGLQDRIQRKVEMQPYHSLPELLHLAVQREKQIKKKTSTRNRSSSSNATWNQQTQQVQQQQQPNPTPYIDKGKGLAIDSRFKSNPEQGKSSNSTRHHDIICFKCQGRGHVSRECPNKRTMILRPDGGYDSQEEVMDEESEEEITIYAEEGDLLVIQRALNSQPVLEDLEQRDNLFHSRCSIQNKVCHLIIDSGSCANIASDCLVEKLGLKAKPHPRPYKLKWLNDKEELKVSKQVEVPLSIGQYKDQILCDVAPMQAGHVLLGRPWQYDRNVAHNGRTNEYSFSFNHCKFILAPLPQKEVRILQSRAKGKSSYFAIPEFLNFDPPDIMHLPLPRECFAGFREPEIKVQELSMSKTAENVMLQGGDMMYHKEKPPLQKFKSTLELEKAKNIPFDQLLKHLQSNHQGKLSDYKHFTNTNLGLFDAGSTVLRTKPLQEGEYDTSMDAYTSGASKERNSGASGDGAKLVAEGKGGFVAESGEAKELITTHHHSGHQEEHSGRAKTRPVQSKSEERAIKPLKLPKELFMESSELCLRETLYSTHPSSTGVHTSYATPDQVLDRASIPKVKEDQVLGRLSLLGSNRAVSFGKEDQTHHPPANLVPTSVLDDSTCSRRATDHSPLPYSVPKSRPNPLKPNG